MERRPLTIGNIMKVADIGIDMVSPDLMKIIANKDTYRDQVLKEHLYSAESILEELEHEEFETNFLNQLIIDELENIKQFIEEHDCGYFRVIYE